MSNIRIELKLKKKMQTVKCNVNKEIAEKAMHYCAVPVMLDKINFNKIINFKLLRIN